MTCTHPETYRCNDPEHKGHDLHCTSCGEPIREIEQFNIGGAYVVSELTHDEPVEDWEKEFHSKLVRWNAPAGSLLILHWEKEKEIINFIHQQKQAAREELKKELLEKIEAVKESVRTVSGSFKYDSCYDDCLNIIKSIDVEK